ncbi:MAG TPA: SpoIIE family protein phosphatase [Chitinispirillaceae bacterium]|nr:SpoIIE family protein phosphatase [Chitinispirillaceae bacterium]
MLIYLLSAGCVLIIAVVIYKKYPLHLIYRSKIGLQDMIDGIDEPLAVISGDYVIKRANKSYSSIVNQDFHEIIGTKCFTTLRQRSSPCTDCKLNHSLSKKESLITEFSQHPTKKGVISISFSPFNLSIENDEPSIIEHIRDITLLEKLKDDLQKKNRSLAKTMKNLKIAQGNIKDELRLARLIQQGILPKSAPEMEGIKIAVSYHPVTDVGGDIYDFIKFSNTRMGIFIGDASGHGLAAAFVGTISKMSLYNHSKEEMPVDQLLANINSDLINNIHTGHYITCFWGIIDIEARTFTFCRAGHPIPVLIKKDASITELRTDGTFIGLIPDTTFEKKTITFEKGDRIYLFTDGIFEVFDDRDHQGEMFGYERFIDMLCSFNSQSFNKAFSSINSQLSRFSYDDDYTFIAIEMD